MSKLFVVIGDYQNGLTWTDLCVRLAVGGNPYAISFQKEKGGATCLLTEREFRQGGQYLTVFDGQRLIIFSREDAGVPPGFSLVEMADASEPDEIVWFVRDWHPDNCGLRVSVMGGAFDPPISTGQRKKVIEAFLRLWPSHRPMPRLVVDNRLVRWGAHRKKKK